MAGNKHFIRNLSFLIFVNVIIKPFWILGVDRTVQNTVGEAEYGIYFALFNYSFLLHVLLDFGINNFNNRAIAQKPELLATYFPNMLVMKVALTLLYLLLCFTGAALFQNFDSRQWHLLGFVCLNQVLISFIFYFRSNLQGLHLFRQDSILSVLDRLLLILICGGLLWGSLTQLSFQIEWFIYAQTFAYSVVALISLIMIVRQLPQLSLQYNWQLIQQIIKQSYPFALLGIFMSIYNRIDAVMLKELLPNGTTEVGIYATAYRLLDAINMIPFLFSTILLPMFSRMLQQKESVHSLVALSASLLYVGAISTAFSCFYFQAPIMELLYQQATPYYTQLFGWLMLSFIAISSVYVYGSLLTANGSLWQLNAIAISGVILNIALNYWLIPTHQALGAVQATLITQTIVAIAHLIAAIYLLKLPLSINSSIKIITYTIGAALIGYATTQLSFHWIFNFSIAGITSLLLAFPIRLIQLAQLKRLF